MFILYKEQVLQLQASVGHTELNSGVNLPTGSLYPVINETNKLLFSNMCKEISKNIEYNREGWTSLNACVFYDYATRCNVDNVGNYCVWKIMDYLKMNSNNESIYISQDGFMYDFEYVTINVKIYFTNTINLFVF